MKHKLILIALILSLLSGFMQNVAAQWVQTNGPCAALISSFAVSGSNLFAGSWSGVFRSSDNGTSWHATGLTHAWVSSFAVSGTNLFAGTSQNGVFRSTDNGTSWTAVNTGLTDTTISSLAVSGTNIFAGTFGGGVFRSTDNGTSWTAVNTGLPDAIVYSLAVSGSNLFAGVDNNAVFRSTDNGASWTAANAWVPYYTALTFATSGTNIFAGTFGGGVWRRPLSDFEPTGVSSFVQPVSTATISPNPITESATIRFHSEDQGSVELRVVNLLGIEVALIFFGELGFGEHSFTWNAIGVPTGMYMCTIRSNSSIEKVPMLVVR